MIMYLHAFLPQHPPPPPLQSEINPRHFSTKANFQQTLSHSERFIILDFWGDRHESVRLTV